MVGDNYFVSITQSLIKSKLFYNKSLCSIPYNIINRTCFVGCLGANTHVGLYSILLKCSLAYLNKDDYCLVVWKLQKDIYKFIIEFYSNLEPTAGARKTSEKILRITARCIRLDPSCAITKDPYLASFQGTWIHIFLFWTSCSHLNSRLD